MKTTLVYLFDPLCGWCYGAGPALTAVAAAGINIELLPTGMFSGPRARMMDDDFASFAWNNDQRIGRLSGQPFSENYRLLVLADRQQRFNSEPASLALTAVALTRPEGGMAALKAIQHARFVAGLDVTDRPTLCAILTQAGLQESADALSQSSQALLDAHRLRVAEAGVLMEQFHASGVPTFIGVSPSRRWLLHGNGIYAEPNALVGQLQAA